MQTHVLVPVHESKYHACTGMVLVICWCSRPYLMGNEDTVQGCMDTYQLFAARLDQTQLDIPPTGDAVSISDLYGQRYQLQQIA